ncbi:MAG: hypothetical protein KKF46_02560 [Nanoarchaeota archaeon]|nr:hypothetical protein [Nanoarchaeota archaeon]MBU1321215.1 hypothetical protein [Nanoarchaeota archaeon]MBU1597020.1 hypothetical protein [Nanoarchaeota archaeon]MBU2441834.1 hypothetical protein [Nanoarchaeota archaeon]
MQKTTQIKHLYDNNVLNICLDTLEKDKQALVFVNTKNSAEAEAERISKKIKPAEKEKQKLEELSQKALKTLDKPTKQCQRLALCFRHGVAFHHAGLHSQQRELVEDNFRNGMIKIICSTPSLALGINLPAFRVIIRDLKRFSGPRGMTWIPVLEFEQFCGRAGRPDFNDTFGEAICIAQSESEKENIIDNYIEGETEEILSKLAVEPILRTYVLSLIATDFANSKKTLMDFFKKTFYAHQFKDIQKLSEIIDRILNKLAEWEFISIKIDKLEATLLGARVSQLYLDPYTAHYLITCLKRAKDKLLRDISFLQMVSYTLELRPLLNVRVREYELVENKAAQYETSILSLEPSMFEPEYEEYIKSIKTALFFQEWINEKDDEILLEEFNVRPGESRAKLERADWLIYASQELSRLIKLHGLISELAKIRLRLKYGAKEELLPLLKLKSVGRTRARKLFNNKIKTIEDVKNVDFTQLSQLIGRATSLSIKKQVGQDLREEKVVVKKGTRKGQTSLKKYDKKKKEKSK